MASYAEIREWAWANNMPVAPTGRIAADVVEAYEAAHPLAPHTTKLDQAGAEPAELAPGTLSDGARESARELFEAGNDLEAQRVILDDLAPEPDVTELGPPPPGGSGPENLRSGPVVEGPAERKATPPSAARRVSPRLPDVLFLPGRGRVRVNKDRPGVAGSDSHREKD